MSKHTPGPWVLIPAGDEWSSGRIATIEPKPETMIDTNFWTVAEVNYRRDEHAANANLIAAAPDLLAACEEFRNVLRSKVRNSQYSEEYAEAFYQAEKKMDQAIARAKGIKP